MQLRDVPFFGVPFFEQKINFEVFFFGKSQVIKLLYRILILINFHLLGKILDGFHNFRIYIFDGM